MNMMGLESVINLADLRLKTYPEQHSIGEMWGMGEGASYITLVASDRIALVEIKSACTSATLKVSLMLLFYDMHYPITYAIFTPKPYLLNR
jgi:hypothetical protein